MRFLVDESTGPSVARWLRGQGHQVFSIYEESRGITDEEVIQDSLCKETLSLAENVPNLSFLSSHEPCTLRRAPSLKMTMQCNMVDEHEKRI
jgi:hypothetical protein